MATASFLTAAVEGQMWGSAHSPAPNGRDAPQLKNGAWGPEFHRMKRLEHPPL